VSLLVVENDPSDPVERLGDWLREAGAILDVRPAGSVLPADLIGVEGIVVMGGAMGASDDAVAPWLPHVRELLRTALAGEVPVLGVCLGAQLLALAAGGRVQPNPDGPEYGAQLVAKRTAAATDPLFGSLPITPDVIQWHVDAVTALPPGAVLLASSPTCEVQAFRIGRLAWGVQFHIEASPATVRRWAANDAVALADYDVDRLVARVDAVADDIAEVWASFAAAFAAVVRDPDSVRPGRAPQVSTAAPITDPAAIRAALAAEAQAAHHHPDLAPLPAPVWRPDE
jgi:GMP synthase (glutamine-hydrolysing)